MAGIAFIGYLCIKLGLLVFLSVHDLRRVVSPGNRRSMHLVNYLVTGRRDVPVLLRSQNGWCKQLGRLGLLHAGVALLGIHD